MFLATKLLAKVEVDRGLYMAGASKLDRLEWDKQVIPEIKMIIEDRKKRGISRLTLRGLFYILVSKNILENIQNR